MPWRIVLVKYRRIVSTKQSSQAIVTIVDPVSGRRKDRILGPFGTSESRSEYARVIAEWESSGRRIIERHQGPDLTINELAVAFLTQAEGSTQELAPEYKLVVRPLKELFGHTLVAQLGPLKLKLFRDRLIADGICRVTVNQRVWRVKKMFAYGVENELVPATVWQALLAVRGLQRGRSNARDTDPVRPVSEEHVRAILPFLSPTVRAVVQIQQLTEMRPGEVCRMRACDIDQSGPIWLYRPSTHKNRWRDKDRIIAIGTKAKLLLKPFLNDESEAFLFRPADAMSYWGI